MIEFVLNGKKIQVDVPGDTPLLWVIREELGLKGTKFGCGKAQCGACTVHLNNSAVRTCVLPVSAASGQSVTTIEGVQEQELHPVQRSWIQHSVPQCGYCQVGQIMSAAAMLKTNPKPTDEQIDEEMSGNICRCGTYNRIRAAIHTAAAKGAR